MTREEAITELSVLWERNGEPTDGRYREALDMAIKALEKASALDKIRAEVEQVAFKDVNGSKYIFVNRVNQIIDKYMVESYDLLPPCEQDRK